MIRPWLLIRQAPPTSPYRDGANSKKATVMKYSGGSWRVVGTAGFSTGMAPWTSLAIDSTGTPCVAYADDGNGDKAAVMRFK